MTAPTYQDSASTVDSEPVFEDAIEIVNREFGYEFIEREVSFASDEADDLVAALQARERLNARSGEVSSLEETIREHGLDPAEFGLE